MSSFRSSARIRPRTGGSKNLKKHEWAWVQQHLRWRNENNMETVFIIHNFKCDSRNVQRKIRRAGGAQIEPVEDWKDLPELPPYIKLEPPLPDRTPIPIGAIDAEPNVEPVPQRPEEPSVRTSEKTPSSPTSSDSHDGESNWECDEDDMEVAGEVFLRNLPLSEILDCFRRPRLKGDETQWNDCIISWLGIVKVRPENSLGTLVNVLYNSGHSGRRMSHFDILRMLTRKGDISVSHFLETVIRKMDGQKVGILAWLSCGLQVDKFGARALGTAAYRNDFEAVERLLGEGVDINDSILGPHSTPDCRCDMNVMAYAQLPRFDDEFPGASDEMLAYLMGQGAEKSKGADTCLLDLLNCVLRQHVINPDLFVSMIRAIVERIHGFADDVCMTGSVLETCILEGQHDKTGSIGGRHQVIEYLLQQGVETSSGSPLAALICTNGPRNLIEKLLAKTENINAYCDSIFDFPVPMKPRPYNMVRSVSPLQAATLRGEEQLISHLLEKGADVNCPARGSCGVTPLQAVCFLEPTHIDPTTKMKIVKLFIEHGVLVNATPAWNLGLSALQAAAFVGDVEVASFLISCGADVNAPACKYGGGTAVALAARRGHVNMVQLLWNEGATIPDADVTVSSFGVTYDDHRRILDLLRISTPVLIAMDFGNGTASRDYHEYEAEWADDPTYENKG